MTIDAWLERRDPRIRVIDNETGRELLCLGPERVHEMMDNGDIYADDFTEATSIELLGLLGRLLTNSRDAERMGCSKPI